MLPALVTLAKPAAAIPIWKPVMLAAALLVTVALVPA
jgi:hypothetical protein